MKNILSLCFATLFIVTNLHAQPAPLIRTTFAVEPSISADNKTVCQIKVVWDQVGRSRVEMLANFDYTTGGLAAIELTCNIGTNFSSYAWPRTGGDLEFKNLDSWKEFAKNMRSRFAVVADNLYVETDAYKVVGVTKVLDGFEGAPDMECLLLKNKFRMISVPAPRWVGRFPEEGETVYLGRERTFKGAFFGAEKASYGGYVIDHSTMTCIHDYRKYRLADSK